MPSYVSVLLEPRIPIPLGTWTTTRFRNEVMRCVLMGYSLALPKDLPIPFIVTNQPHRVGARVELRAHREAASRCSISKPGLGPGQRLASRIAEIATGGQKSGTVPQLCSEEPSRGLPTPACSRCRHVVETALTAALKNSIFLTPRCKNAIQHPGKSSFEVLAPKPVHNDRSLRL